MMGNQKREYKRREDFTDEEWKEIVTEAWRLRAEKGWGRVKIAKKLGISPNTVGCWINNQRTPEKEIDQYEGILQYRIIDCMRMYEEDARKGKIEREEADKALKELAFCYKLNQYNIPYYKRRKRIEKEGDDSYLAYS